MQEASLDEFLEDPTLAPATERYFQIAIQAALDIGTVILTEEGVKTPENYRGDLERFTQYVGEYVYQKGQA